MNYSCFYYLHLIVLIGFTAQAAWGGEELRNLAPYGTFEEEVGEFYGWIPLGVVIQDDLPRVRIVEGEAHTGKKSLQIVPGPPGVVKGLVYYADYNSGESKREVSAQGGVRGARTFAMRLEPSMTAMTSSVWVKGATDDTFSFSAVWTTRLDRKNPVVEIRRDVVKKSEREEGEWQQLEIQVERPSKAHQLQLWLETEGDTPLLVDDVNLRFTYKPEIMLLVDQLGYAPDSLSKTAVLQSTQPLSEVPQAQLLDEQTGKVVWQADWVAHGLLPTWDRYHWKVDFSEVKRPGRYVLAIRDGVVTTRSAPFQIADNLLTTATAELAYRFYYYQRCGIEIPGFHAACHLDDATMPDGSHRDLTGGWHDAGDYNKYNGLTPESVYALAWAYHCKPELYDQWDRDENGLADILDEAIWGAQFLEKMLDVDRMELLNSVSSGYRYWGAPEKETDNLPNTVDERLVRPGNGNPSYCVAGFALLGQALKKSSKQETIEYGQQLVDLAEKFYEKIGGGVDRLIPLYEATEKEHYRELARQRAQSLLESQPQTGVSGFRELAYYAITFPEDKLAAKIQPLGNRRAKELTAICDDRFDVAQRPEDGDSLVYCRSYNHVNDWYVGETSYRLDAAIDGLLASRLGAPLGRKIAEDQIHWLLGRNPYGMSYMEGVGSKHLPHYHHRYNMISGNPRGAVPGALINGAVRAWPHLDRPWLDLHSEPNPDYQCNEPWLKHNNSWLMMYALW
jgi:hypothetical protein